MRRAELKDAGAAAGRHGGAWTPSLAQNLSTQLLYLLAWHETLPEPAGSYFSTNDFASPGGRRVVLGFGSISDLGVDFTSLGGGLIKDFQSINRLPDHKPPDSGQYGINVKLYLPNFSQGTQLGFYFLNYTSRLPVVSSQTGTQQGFGNGFGAVNAVAGAAQALAAGLPFQAAVATGAALGQQRAAQLGGNLSAAAATEYATIGANTLLSGGNVAAQAQSFGTYEYGKTAGYYDEFPQDIKLLGVSFNTQIQKTGTALQGEVAYRHNVPLQVDDVELLDASLTPFESGVAQLLGEPVSAPGHCQPTSATPVTGCSQLGAYGLTQVVRGYVRKDTWRRRQFTATQIFANVLKASQAVLLFEGAVDYIPGLENKYSGGPVGLGLRYEAPGTNLSGSPELGSYPQFPNLSTSPARRSRPAPRAGGTWWPDAWSTPISSLRGTSCRTFTWSQGVSGISPGPGGNFIEGRHALTLGVGASLALQVGSGCLVHAVRRRRTVQPDSLNDRATSSPPTSNTRS